MKELQLYDIGTKFLVTVKDQDEQVYSLSGLTVEFWFCKPDKSINIKTPTLVGGGIDGEVYYITESGDINTPGLWRLQLKVNNDDYSKDFHTDISTFRVRGNVPE